MSQPLLSVDKELVSAPDLKERNYLGLSDCSSVGSSNVSDVPEDEKSNFNFNATELRLGLPGLHSPERDIDFALLSPRTPNEKLLFPLKPSKEPVNTGHKNVVSGNKRGFSDTLDELSEVKGSVYSEKNWMFNGAESNPESARPGTFATKPGINIMLTSKPSGSQSATKKDLLKSTQEELSRAKTRTCQVDGSNNAPAAKAQVVGWPPIRSYRKNTMASSSKNNDEVDGKPGLAALFVKVSMDGAPYLRKVDLRTYTCYPELYSALEKMFSCFITLGQCGPHGAKGRERLSEIKLKDLLHGSEFVLTYEDKDGDWMLVGDVPWKMFTDSCRKLKIMKGSDAIGLAPRAMEKSKNKDLSALRV